MTCTKPVKILLIDDDQCFGQLMQAAAAQEQIDLTYYPSLESMGSLGKLGEFQHVLLDLHLEQMLGTEIAEYLDAFFKTADAVLISADTFERGSKPVPHCIKGFLKKGGSVRELLHQAIALVSADPKATESHDAEGKS